MARKWDGEAAAGGAAGVAVHCGSSGAWRRLQRSMAQQDAAPQRGQRSAAWRDAVPQHGVHPTSGGGRRRADASWLTRE